LAKIIINTDKLKNIIYQYFYGYLVDEMIDKIIVSGEPYQPFAELNNKGEQ
jgi:hypothetical protein